MWKWRRVRRRRRQNPKIRARPRRNQPADPKFEDSDSDFKAEEGKELEHD